MRKCRICGNFKEEDSLVATLNEKASTHLTYKDYLEKFACVKYNEESIINQKICSLCIAEINFVIQKADFWHKQENNLTQIQKRRNTVAPNIVEEKSCFKKIKELFKLDGQNLTAANERFSRIEIDHSNLEPDGAISNLWIKERIMQYTVWGDMLFTCECKQEVKSLFEYIKHLNIHDFWKFPCPEKDCNKIYNTLTEFMNHAISDHFEYLAFCCIQCSKIFYNIPKLIDHYEKEHMKIQSLYICVECGCYCRDFSYLKTHKASHNMDECEFKPDDLDNVKIKKVVDTVVKQKRGRARKSSPRSTVSMVNLKCQDTRFHPKTHAFDGNFHRQTYPCLYPGCERILTTKSGFEYHKLVHDGSTPYPCSLCPKRFRSKQLLLTHKRNHHTNP